jgi:hypothetical protein
MGVQSIALDVIEVSQPCPASWDAMRGDEQVRYCEGCTKYVHNLSAMTREQATALVARCGDAGATCVRFSRSAGGMVETLDYRGSTGPRGRGWRFWTALGACLAAGVTAVNAVVFRSAIPLPPPFGRPQPTLVMGAMRMPPAPTPAAHIPATPPTSDPQTWTTP